MNHNDVASMKVLVASICSLLTLWTSLHEPLSKPSGFGTPWSRAAT